MNYKFYLTILLLSVNQTSHAERIYSVVFNNLPQNYQLYPRNPENEAVVPISGIIEATGWSHMSVQVMRNNVLVKYLKATITYNSKGIGSFSTETKIKAELAGYDFRVYACKTTDSVVITERKNIVSGDVYVLSGQSNSTGFFAEKDTNQFCRTFGKITDELNTFPYDPADTLWTLSNMNPYKNGVGTMGFEIQKQLMEKSGVPNCLINGGFHWSAASAHAHRTDSNPADLTNGYGRMLYRIQKGGLANAVKAFIFRQGESEAYHEGFNWPESFDKLRKNLKLDLPALKKIYVFQIDIIYFNSPIGAEVRDYQRRLPEIYPDVVSLATVGTKVYDGLHYGREGNKQGGFEISRLIARDLYGSADTSNIDSPSLKKAFYKTAEKKQLILSFEEGQELVYPDKYKPNGNVTLDMKDFFYLNGSSGGVASGKAEGNHIVLDLNGTQNAGTINYLPMFVEAGGSYFPYTGPYLTNKLGMRAFSFHNVNIADALAIPVITASVEAGANVKLTWGPVAGATEYLLERKLSDQTVYTKIANVTELQAPNFVDKSVPGKSRTYYRVKALSKTAESGDYGHAEIESPVILGNPLENSEFFTVFPNPVLRPQPVNIFFRKHVKGILSLINSSGQVVQNQTISDQKDVVLHISDESSAYYFIQLTSGDNVWSKKILIR